MKSINRSLLVVFLFALSTTLLSQNDVNDFDRIYGPDQTLCNGKKYDYIAPLGSNGNQFFISPFFTAGSVTIKGKCYQGLTLNYDILNQQLLLQFANDNHPWNIIELSKAWLQEFTLGTLRFELLNLEQEPQFYQVLGEGKLQILFYWRKSLNLNDVIGTHNFVFTPALRDSFILMNGQLKPFNTKHSLLMLFDPERRPDIKSYLRKNKIKVKKASDHVMAELINFIDNLN